MQLLGPAGGYGAATCGDPPEATAIFVCYGMRDSRLYLGECPKAVRQSSCLPACRDVTGRALPLRVTCIGIRAASRWPSARPRHSGPLCLSSCSGAPSSRPSFTQRRTVSMPVVKARVGAFGVCPHGATPHRTAPARAAEQKRTERGGVAGRSATGLRTWLGENNFWG